MKTPNVKLGEDGGLGLGETAGCHHAQGLPNELIPELKQNDPESFEKLFSVSTYSI